jgi:hypothetical protein
LTVSVLRGHLNWWLFGHAQVRLCGFDTDAGGTAAQ